MSAARAGGAACADAAADSPYSLASCTVGPLCMHGRLLTPRAAHTLREAMRAWLAQYHATVVRYYANSTFDPGAATCDGLRWIKGMAFAINGHDVALREAIQEGTLQGLHVWPQLVEQASKVRASLAAHSLRRRRRFGAPPVHLTPPPPPRSRDAAALRRRSGYRRIVEAPAPGGLTSPTAI